MSRKLQYISFLIIALMSIIAFNSCGKEDPDNPIAGGVTTRPVDRDDFERTVLVYAVASNSLQSALISDKAEMLKIAPQLELDRCAYLIYQVTKDSDPELLRLMQKEDGEYGFESVKNYDRNQYSTDPKRISAVIKDAFSICPSENRGIIFWSHGSGWLPEYSDHEVIVKNNVNSPSSVAGTSGKIDFSEERWFGQDTYYGKSDYTDIIELAEDIPTNYFDFIWFDCCYMSSIETIYQLRDKCRYIIASPMEIAADGMPYDLTLPFLVKEKPNYVAAVDALCDYYIDERLPVAMMVGDMKKIGGVADAVSLAMLEETEPVLYQLFTYSRYPFGPYYDIKQYWKRALPSSSETLRKIEEALNEFIIHKSHSSKGFNGQEIPVDDACCISMVKLGEEDKHIDYYRLTDWYRALSLETNVHVVKE